MSQTSLEYDEIGRNYCTLVWMSPTNCHKKAGYVKLDFDNWQVNIYMFETRTIFWKIWIYGPNHWIVIIFDRNILLG